MPNVNARSSLRTYRSQHSHSYSPHTDAHHFHRLSDRHNHHRADSRILLRTFPNFCYMSTLRNIYLPYNTCSSSLFRYYHPHSHCSTMKHTRNVSQKMHHQPQHKANTKFPCKICKCSNRPCSPPCSKSLLQDFCEKNCCMKDTNGCRLFHSNRHKISLHLPTPLLHVYMRRKHSALCRPLYIENSASRQRVACVFSSFPHVLVYQFYSVPHVLSYRFHLVTLSPSAYVPSPRHHELSSRPQ
mmetsp:Transcript_19878/g.33615  ORF Transcript_19878/g.33615 Transcript_19878/m.33615 type:complete len:242 (+) Transcript_19878:103-828(+)